MTRKHIHEEEFEVPIEKAFALLITPSAIRDWWGADRAIVMPEKGGIWVAAWGEDEDSPAYVSAFTMAEYDPPRRILFTDAKYTASGQKLPFEMNMTTEFLFETTAKGSKIKVIQDGFPVDPAADEFYAACEKGWKDTFMGIRRHLDSKPSRP
ncbi:MAG: SRPBCC domain-containing protein [Acidobacteriota bacterium]|nr:SRPBCC domain-containing protein [Acidobacteriota bacterium]MDH3529633.1 SRPBCC domain-containing protein [Acidobacteriota bacterium]